MKNMKMLSCLLLISAAKLNCSEPKVNGFKDALVLATKLQEKSYEQREERVSRAATDATQNSKARMTINSLLSHISELNDKISTLNQQGIEEEKTERTQELVAEAHAKFIEIEKYRNFLASKEHAAGVENAIDAANDKRAQDDIANLQNHNEKLNEEYLAKKETAQIAKNNVEVEKRQDELAEQLEKGVSAPKAEKLRDMLSKLQEEVEANNAKIVKFAQDGKISKEEAKRSAKITNHINSKEDKIDALEAMLKHLPGVSEEDSEETGRLGKKPRQRLNKRTKKVRKNQQFIEFLKAENTELAEDGYLKGKNSKKINLNLETINLLNKDINESELTEEMESNKLLMGTLKTLVSEARDAEDNGSDTKSIKIEFSQQLSFYFSTFGEVYSVGDKENPVNYIASVQNKYELIANQQELLKVMQEAQGIFNSNKKDDVKVTVPQGDVELKLNLDEIKSMMLAEKAGKRLLSMIKDARNSIRQNHKDGDLLSLLNDAKKDVIKKEAVVAKNEQALGNSQDKLAEAQARAERLAADNKKNKQDKKAEKKLEKSDNKEEQAVNDLAEAKVDLLESREALATMQISFNTAAQVLSDLIEEYISICGVYAKEGRSYWGSFFKSKTGYAAFTGNPAIRNKFDVDQHLSELDNLIYPQLKDALEPLGAQSEGAIANSESDAVSKYKNYYKPMIITVLTPEGSQDFSLRQVDALLKV